MRNLLFIFAILFTSQLSAAKKIIQDPQFKKKDKYWHVKITEEYRGIKPIFDRNLFTIRIPNASRAHYLALVTEAPVKAGKIYQVSFKIKGQGEGEIYSSMRSFPNVFKGKHFEKDDELINLGLHQKFKITPEWQKVTCTFKAEKNPASNLIESFMLMMGMYKGEVSVSGMAFIELKDSKITSPPLKR